MKTVEAIQNIDWTQFVKPERKHMQGKTSDEVEAMFTPDFRETVKRAIIADMIIAAIKEIR